RLGSGSCRRARTSADGRGQEVAPRRRGIREEEDGTPREGRGVGSSRRQRRAGVAQTGGRAGETAEAGPLRAVRRGAGNAAGGEPHAQGKGRMNLRRGLVRHSAKTDNLLE